MVSGLGAVCIQEVTLYNTPGYLYQGDYAPGGGYDTFTAYLTSTTLPGAVKASRNIRAAASYGQAGMLSLISAHREAIREYYRKRLARR